MGIGLDALDWFGDSSGKNEDTHLNNSWLWREKASRGNAGVNHRGEG